MAPLMLRNCATVAEAAAALTNEREARYFGGGTLVMRDVNEGDLSFSALVRTTDRSLARIETTGQRLVIGAGVTYAAVLAERELSFLHPVARSIGGPAVRNMGTIGGNLFAPAPFGDFAAALLALDATVLLQGGYANRETPIEEFLAARERGFGALVLAVSFARPAGPEAFRYRKMARVKPKGGSVVTVAAHLPTSGGRVMGARIAFGSMGATALRAKSAERALEGRPLDAAAISAAANAALEGLSPVDDALASAWYRREVAGVQLRRLLSGEAS
jgi:xanthine dehydrogenase small subunit